MSLPLRPDQMSVGTGWRYRKEPRKGELHAAHDYEVPIGTHVFAVRDGTVLARNDDVPNDSHGEPSNWILLGITYKGRPATVYYQHLSPGLDVKVGERVTAGQKLGESGSSGHATGPHLHLAAMWGRRDSIDKRYDYMDDIPLDEDAPKDGTASNNICIFPPSLVFVSEEEEELMALSEETLRALARAVLDANIPKVTPDGGTGSVRGFLQNIHKQATEANTRSEEALKIANEIRDLLKERRDADNAAPAPSGAGNP